MRISVKKWATAQRPALEAAQVQVDEDADIREETGRIVIEPVREKLDDLLGAHH